MRFVNVAATALSLMSVPADAQPGPPIAELDRNNDGIVSRDEFIASLKPLFLKIDKDQSGAISKGEMRSFAIKHMFVGGRPPKDLGPPPKFDRNGEIRFDTFSAMMVEVRFNPADLDRNGVLSRREIALAERN